MTILIVTLISAYSSILTQTINQAQAETLDAAEQKKYVRDIHDTFKPRVYL